MIIIDGSSGEGGGQVLRSSLALSCIAGIPFKIFNIRANRPEPGLRPQHLKSVEAAVEISSAGFEGAQLGSKELVFSPGRTRRKKYRFEIGTAGSTSLLLQTIFIPLAFANGISQFQLSGGTHVPWSPCFDYLKLNWLHYMNKIGYPAAIKLENAGFYPRGGGQINGRIKPALDLKPLDITERGELIRIRGISGVSNLDLSIATRQKHQALKRLEPIHRDVKIQTHSLPGPSKGTYLLLFAEFEHSQSCFFALGKKGKPAETVADEAVNELCAFLETDGAVDKYLADQLLLPLSLVEDQSILRTEQITPHLLTNVEIISKFLPVNIVIAGEGGHSGLIKIQGKQIRHRID
jgi:RNA 3'-phosphate cyclase